MRPILCDICRQETDEVDIRYIEIYSWGELEENRNMRATKEICTICAVAVADAIDKIRQAHEA